MILTTQGFCVIKRENVIQSPGAQWTQSVLAARIMCKVMLMKRF